MFKYALEYKHVYFTDSARLCANSGKDRTTWMEVYGRCISEKTLFILDYEQNLLLLN